MLKFSRYFGEGAKKYIVQQMAKSNGIYAKKREKKTEAIHKLQKLENTLV